MSGFRDIIGHREIIKVLTGALASGKISHAYLFGGPGGTGKTTLALAFAQVLLCTEPRGSDPCSLCRSCRQFESGNHPDFHYLQPDGESIKISQIRELQRKVSLRPFQGTRKVFIIGEADTMTREAANSFLMTLEEPPEGVIFILISDFPQSLLSTISSRCQQFNFKPLSNNEISLGLKKLRGMRERDCRLPVMLAGGSLGKALELAESNRERDQLLSLLGKLKETTPAGVSILAREMAEGEVNLQRFLDMLSLWYRDILIWKKTRRKNFIVNLDRAGDIESEADKLSVHRIIQNIKAVERAGMRLSFRANARLVLEDLFYTLAGFYAAREGKMIAQGSRCTF